MSGVLLVAIMIYDFAKVASNWREADGYEYAWIAESIAQGHGFSFRGDRRHLFDSTVPADETDPTRFYPTAWGEPIYPYLLGAYLWAFGEHGRLLMLVTNVLLLGGTLLLVYDIGERIGGSAVGLSSAAILAFVPDAHFIAIKTLGNTILAGFLISLCAVLLLRWLEDSSFGRSVFLGFTIGITTLTHTAAIVFGPIAFVLILSGRSKLERLRSGCFVFFLAALIVSPWTVRNYLTFGQFVPVRTGFGDIAFVGNPATAATWQPTVVAEDAPAEVPWRAASLVDAVRQPAERRLALFGYSRATARARATPEVYAQLNEPERDRVLLRGAAEFILKHPVITAQLTLAKTARFFFFRPIGIICGLGILGVLGAVLSFRDRQACALTLIVLGYAAPYAIAFPHFYRYRYPIEPLIVVLAALAVLQLTVWTWYAARRRGMAKESAA